jgi:hypothetical protein
MSEQVFPSAVSQHIFAKLLTNKKVETTEVVMRVRAQFNEEILIRT